MSADRQSRLVQRTAGKWQIPLLVLAAPLFAATVMWSRPEPEPLPIDEILGEIDLMAGSLLLPEAEATARRLLRSGRLTTQQQAPVYAALADIKFRKAQRRLSNTDKQLVNILAVYAQAELQGYVFDGDDLARQGQVMEWLGQPSGASEQYQKALERNPSEPLEVRQRLIGLHLEDPDTDRTWLHDQLDSLIQDATERSDVLTWTLEQKIDVLLEEGRTSESETLLSEYGPALEGTEHDLFKDYMSALVRHRSGQHDDAELILRNLSSQMDSGSPLHARTQWLLGRVVLRDDGPQRPIQALDYFHEVITSHPATPYAAAARLGTAEALTALQRYDEALTDYRRLLRDLKQINTGRLINRGAVQASLAVLSQQLKDSEHFDSSLAYLQLATDLIDPSDMDRLSAYLLDLANFKERVGTLKRSRARQSSNPDTVRELQKRSRELLLSAAADFETLATVNPMDEDFTAEALWQAAILSDSGGNRGRTIELMEQFREERPNSTYIPRVLHRLGQAYQAEGHLDLAIDRYQTCIREYARNASAQDSIIPLADCFIMLGGDYTAQAEQTLQFILEEPADQPTMFTPVSMLYRDALFRLGELYARDGRYGEAIVRLDEALQRYPQDPRITRGTFLIADAYRQSALALDTTAGEIGGTLRRQELQRRKRDRLLQAEVHFGQVIEQLSSGAAGQQTAGRGVQLMLSYMYRGDCAFDAGDFDAALERYQEVVRVYPDQPIALAAYVQIISCLETMGRAKDVDPALRRAEYLAGRINPVLYEDDMTGRDAGQWQKLFAWMRSTAAYN